MRIEERTCRRMRKTRVFAAYLPQYHETPENNLFWGEGFTDWVGVKNAKTQYGWQRQPRVPMNENYYDLSDYKNILWQSNLAKQYGIDGFCIYHYWFEAGKSVLDTPAKLILAHSEIDISFFFSWDNSSWIRSWSNISGNAWAPQFDKKDDKKQEYLLKHEYGNKQDWKQHFEWLLPFFKDKRYYKIDGKPVFIMFCVDNKRIMTKMQQCWNDLAVNNHLPGIYMISGVGPFRNQHCLDAQFKYQPLGIWNKRKAIQRRLGKYLHISGKAEYKNIWEYKKAWNIILRQSRKCVKHHIYTSAIVRYDDTPRRGKKANIIRGESPLLFEKFFSQFYSLNTKYNMEFLLLTAWNEWGEGAYLEPDTVDGYAYLEAVSKVLENYKV